jgi:hypothetical protein
MADFTDLEIHLRAATSSDDNGKSTHPVEAAK